MESVKIEIPMAMPTMANIIASHKLSGALTLSAAAQELAAKLTLQPGSAARTLMMAGSRVINQDTAFKASHPENKSATILKMFKETHLPCKH